MAPLHFFAAHDSTTARRPVPPSLDRTQPLCHDAAMRSRLPTAARYGADQPALGARLPAECPCSTSEIPTAHHVRTAREARVDGPVAGSETPRLGETPR